MSKIIYRVTVDVMRGVDRKDSRWSPSGRSGYELSERPYAFWDTIVTTQPGKEDLRRAAKRRTQGIQEGERPGQLPSQQFAPFTTVDPEKGDSLYFPEDRVAVLQVVKSNKKLTMEQNDGYQVVGTEKTPGPVSYQVADAQIDYDGVDVLFETNSFLLQNIREAFQEKFQISETFGEPIVFFFSERQKIFQFSGILFDSSNWSWKEKFIDNYERHLRGTAAVESGAVAVLTTHTAIFRGFILSCGIAQNETYGMVAFDFTMFVKDRIPLETIERSPQEDSKSKEEEVTREAFFRINDMLSKPGQLLRELSFASGVIALPDYPGQPEGFNTVDFGPNYASHVSITPAFAVNGVAVPRYLKLGVAAHGIVTPSDIEFWDPVPAGILGQVLSMDLGELKRVRDPSMEVPGEYHVPGVEGLFPYATMAVTPGQASSFKVMYHRGFPCPYTHSLSQIKKMKDAVGIEGLSVYLVLNNGTEAVFNKVKEVRRYNDSPAKFLSKDTSTQRPLGSVEIQKDNAQLAFEIELEFALTRSAFGFSGDFVPADQIRVAFFRENQFVLTDGAPALCYHVNREKKALAVGDQAGLSKHAHLADTHILTNPAGQFMSVHALHLDLAADNKVYVTLPYQVVQKGAATLTPTTLVEVIEVLSDTQLKLRRLTKTVANLEQLPRQDLAKITLGNHKVQVYGGARFQLDEQAIKDSVKNPPFGAFSGHVIETAELVQPRGFFELAEEYHYRKYT